MTALRAPLSFADAMTRVAGVIGWPACAAIAGRGERAVRYWSEDARDTTPPIATALALDAAYQAAGGEGAPFRDAYAFQLEGVQIRQDACRRELADTIAEVARETGEAVAASIVITQSNASPLQTLRALAEANQALGAARRLVRRLTPFLPTGAGPIAGKSGGTL